MTLIASPFGDAAFEERFVVERNYDGWRLDRYLTQKLHRATRTRVAEMIRTCARFGDGRPIKPGARVRAGDLVILDRVEEADPETPPIEAVSVLLEREDLIVLNKPAGMLVHRTAHEATRTIEEFLARRWPGERVEAVHRLDRDTSGCLLCARTIESVRALRAAFVSREVDKTYLAAVRDPDAAWSAGLARSFSQPLGFDRSSGVRLRIGPGDLPCTTDAVSVLRRGSVALLQIAIDQGRQHQIRAHLAMFGTPIVGDKLYAMGDDFFLRWRRDPGDPALAAQLETRWHCLHAVRMRLRSLDGSTVLAEAPLPPHMDTWRDLLPSASALG